MDKQEWIKLHAYLRWHNREIKMGCKPQDEEERRYLEKLDWELTEMDWEIQNELLDTKKFKI